MAQATESAEDLIREHAPEIAEQIKKAAQEAWGNEAHNSEEIQESLAELKS